MLRSLHVRNYVLIDSLEIDFPEGLVIITGQTGAGKSILLGALGLVLGGKADASLVGAHGDTCVVEAEFSVGNDERLKEILRENDLEESGSLLIRRTLNKTGRSRSFVNDEPVSLPVLQALAERLIDIHAQHQTLRLADPAFRPEPGDVLELEGVAPAQAQEPVAGALAEGFPESSAPLAPAAGPDGDGEAASVDSASPAGAGEAASDQTGCQAV